MEANKSLFVYGNDVQETLNYYLKKTFENLSDRKDFLLAGLRRNMLPLLVTIEADFPDYLDSCPKRRTQDLTQIYQDD